MKIFDRAVAEAKAIALVHGVLVLISWGEDHGATVLDLQDGLVEAKKCQSDGHGCSAWHPFGMLRKDSDR